MFTSRLSRPWRSLHVLEHAPGASSSVRSTATYVAAASSPARASQPVLAPRHQHQLRAGLAGQPARRGLADAAGCAGDRPPRRASPGAEPWQPSDLCRLGRQRRVGLVGLEEAHHAVGVVGEPRRREPARAQHVDVCGACRTPPGGSGRGSTRAGCRPSGLAPRARAALRRPQRAGCCPWAGRPRSARASSPSSSPEVSGSGSTRWKVSPSASGAAAADGDGLHHVVHRHDVEGRLRAAELHERLAGAAGRGPPPGGGSRGRRTSASRRSASRPPRWRGAGWSWARRPRNCARPDLGLELGGLVVVLEALAHDQLVLVDDARCAAPPRRRCSRTPGARGARPPRTAPARCRCRPRSPAAPAPRAPPGRRWRPGGTPARPRPAGARSRCRTDRAARSAMSPPTISIRSGAISAAAFARGVEHPRLDQRDDRALAVLVQQPPRQPPADEAGKAGEQVDRHGAESMAPASP